MADGNILSDFGIDLLEEEIDDVIFQTNEFLTDATFTGSQGPFWWIFLILGIAGVIASLSIDNVILSSLLGVFAFSSFWTIKEVFEQEERVQKGWFPKNPKRKYKF